MENLTKEQKLEILSKAIDAGYYIEIRQHSMSFEEGNQFLDDNSFPVDDTFVYCAESNETSWLKYDSDKFEVTLFFNKLVRP